MQQDQTLTADERIEVIKQYAQQSKIDLFIETGTCDGYTTNALIGTFEQLATIELDPDFYAMSVERFRNEQKVLCFFGDSAKMLSYILQRIPPEVPKLFWLDAHYDGRKTRGEKDTPVLEELQAIWQHSTAKDVILIDDARFFGTDPNYPTLNQINDFISPLTLELKDDIIRIQR